MGKVVTSTTTSASGIWNLRESQLAVQAVAWPGVTAADSASNRNILTMKAIAVDGATPAAFRDGSTNNFAATRNGDVTQGTFSPYYPSGYWSGYFDGTGDFVSVPPNANLLFGTGDFCIEFWVNPQTTSSAVNQIWVVSPGGAERNGVAIGMRNGYMWWLVGDGSTWVFERNAGTALDLNVWSHVAVTRSGGTARFFVNGVLIDSLANTTNINQGTAWTIGGYGGVGYYLTGHMSNVRFVKGSAVYTSNFTPPTTPLTAIANTSLLCLQDNRFRDNSTNNFTISKAGDVAVARFSPFVSPRITAAATSTGSVYFSSSSTNLSIPSSAALNPASGDFTFECWLNPNNWTNTYIGIFVTLVGNGLWIGKNGSNFVVRTAYVADLLQYATMPPVGVWTHMAVVRSGTTLSMFFNGTRVATVTNSTTFVQGTSYVADDGGGSYYAGYISNLRLVKGTAVYDPTQTTLTVPTAALTAITNTSLLTAQSASTVTDASTNAATITKLGTANANDAAPFKRVNYTYDGSGYFDGSGDYLTLSATSSNFPGNGAYCIEAWIYPTAAGACTIIGWGDLTTNKANVLRLSNNEVGRGYELINYWWANDLYSSSTNVYALNTWQHVAATFDGTTRRLFVNGAIVGSDTPTGHNVTTFNNVTIGAQPGGGQPFVGYISNVRVVNSAVYTSAFTPPAGPVTAITNTSLLVDFDNAGIYDSIGRSNLRTLGTAKVSTSTTKWGTASIALDGTANCCVKAIPTSDQPYSFGTGDFTIEMWFRLTSMGTHPALFDWRPASTSTASPCIMVSYGGANKLTYYMGTATAITGTTNITTGTWYHAALCRAGGTTRLFLDGAQEGGSYADANNYTGPNPTFGALGYDPSLTQYTLNGFLEDIRVSRVARYTAAFTPPTAPFA
jgi:hypothetical protein